MMSSDVYCGRNLIGDSIQSHLETEEGFITGTIVFCPDVATLEISSECFIGHGVTTDFRAWSRTIIMSFSSFAVVSLDSDEVAAFTFETFVTLF